VDSCYYLVPASSVSLAFPSSVKENVATWFASTQTSAFLANVEHPNDWNLQRFDTCVKFVAHSSPLLHLRSQLLSTIASSINSSPNRIDPLFQDTVSDAQCTFSDITKMASKGNFGFSKGNFGFSKGNLGGVILLLMRLASDDFACLSCLLSAPDTVFDSVWNKYKEICGVSISSLHVDKSSFSSLQSTYAGNIFHPPASNPQVSSGGPPRHDFITVARHALATKALDMISNRLKAAVTHAEAYKIYPHQQWKTLFIKSISSQSMTTVLNATIQAVIAAIATGRTITVAQATKSTESCISCRSASPWARVRLLTRPHTDFAQRYWCWLDFGESLEGSAVFFFSDWWYQVSLLRQQGHKLLRQSLEQKSAETDFHQMFERMRTIYSDFSQQRKYYGWSQCSDQHPLNVLTAMNYFHQFLKEEVCLRLPGFANPSTAQSSSGPLFLERRCEPNCGGDSIAQRAVQTVAQPVFKPAYDGMDAAETLLRAVGQTAKGVLKLARKPAEYRDESQPLRNINELRPPNEAWMGLCDSVIKGIEHVEQALDPLLKARDESRQVTGNRREN